jgi:hypothetical protein
MDPEPNSENTSILGVATSKNAPSELKTRRFSCSEAETDFRAL